MPTAGRQTQIAAHKVIILSERRKNSCGVRLCIKLELLQLDVTSCLAAGPVVPDSEGAGTWRDIGMIRLCMYFTTQINLFDLSVIRNITQESEVPS